MRVLVIKLGALGDFVQSFAAFDRIRSAHREAEITLLTTPPFADLAAASGLFDRVDTDGRPRRWGEQIKLLRRLRRERYDRVYDLQTSSRSQKYFYAFLPRPPQWSGISLGCSHRQTRCDRDAMHNLDRIADQMHVAGIGPAYGPRQAPPPDLRWAAQVPGHAPDLLMARLGLSPPFVLLAPGASPAKPAKLWPVARYGDLARLFDSAGFQVAVIGGAAEGDLYVQIAAAQPQAVDLTGKTSLLQLASLGTVAAVSVGNDSGPTHLLAYAGAPGLMLMSAVSNPGHCGPRGRMQVLKVDDLSTLGAAPVFEACAAALARSLSPAWAEVEAQTALEGAQHPLSLEPAG